MTTADYHWPQTRSTVISEQPTSLEPFRSTERYIGPTIVAPLNLYTPSRRRVKEEEVESEGWDDEAESPTSGGEAEAEVDGFETESGPSRPRQSRPSKTTASVPRRKSASARAYAEVGEEDGEDDEMAIGYKVRRTWRSSCRWLIPLLLQARQSTTLGPSPSVSKSRGPGTHAINQRNKHPEQQLSHSSPIKNRRSGTGQIQPRRGTGDINNPKKRKLGSGRVLDDASYTGR